MTQPAPQTPPSPAPLPRLAVRRPAARSARPRFTLLDTFNCVLFPLLFGGTCALARVPLTTGTVLAALTVAILYALGWRVGGRACGTVAALLLSTSLPFAQNAALAPHVLGAMAGTALFLLLWTLAAARAARFALVAAALAIVGGLAAGGAWGQEAGPHFAPSLVPLATLFAPGAALLTWFMLPFLPELGDKQKRARWLLCLVWAALSCGAACLCAWEGAPLFLLTLPPALLLSAGGVARLLPTLAGDIPALRYPLAAAAVVGLVLLRARAEWGF